MNLLDSICELMKNSKENAEGDHGTGDPVYENSEEGIKASRERTAPRDGMTAESVKFLIGACANNKSLNIRAVENKGRYFTAQVLNPKGRVVNELLVDKLNGAVKFIR
jgi:hypothetical protein